MQQGRIERRRERRLELRVPLRVHRVDAPPEDFTEAATTNLSLGGLYFESEGDERYAQDELVAISVSIPESASEVFPFRRLVGRSRVVRVDTLPSQGGAERPRQGVALKFGDDILALTGIPSRG